MLPVRMGQPGESTPAHQRPSYALLAKVTWQPVTSALPIKFAAGNSIQDNQETDAAIDGQEIEKLGYLTGLSHVRVF